MLSHLSRRKKEMLKRLDVLSDERREVSTEAFTHVNDDQGCKEARKQGNR